MDQSRRSDGASPQTAVQLCGIEFPNPFILASGVLGIAGSVIRRVADAGAGGAVTKTVSYEPREGYDNPVVVEVDGGFLNAVGIPNPGFRHFRDEIVTAKLGGIPVIASAMAKNPEEFAMVAAALEDYGANAIELNVSCPNVDRMGDQVGQDSSLLKDVVQAVTSKVGIPVWVKLTPNVSSIVEEGIVCEESGADALVAINTLKAMTIDVDTFKPILSNRFGGLSGPAIRTVAVRCVYELYENVSIPVIGVGGVTDWRAAVEFFLAGAQAVQVGTSIAYSGLDIFNDLNVGLQSFIRKKGFSSTSDIVGLAHKR